MLKVKEVRMNYERNLMGIDEMPRFTWIIEDGNRNTLQTAYRIQVSEDAAFKSVIFDSGRKEEAQSVNVVLPETIVLKSRKRYYVRVMVWDNHGECSAFSKPGEFVTGLLDKEWKGSFISAEDIRDMDKSGSTYIRKRFHAGNSVKQAYVNVTALGLYKLYLNGRKIGEDELAPGWTSYNKHLLYQTYDVTEALKEGENTIGAITGAGWYKGKMGFLHLRNNYGKQSALLCELYIEYEDGTVQLIVSDSTWEGTEGPVIFSEIYDGETYDASMEIEGWNLSGTQVGNWHPVSHIEFDKSVLKAQAGCRVKVKEQIPAKKLIITPQGDKVIDFGQNLAGWVWFKAAGKKGDIVRFQCFEVLDKNGNVYTDNLRTAKQRIEYIFGENEEITYQPSFTFQGFRYIHIEEYPGNISLDNFEACAVYSDMERCGWFSCSNPDLNQLQHNILWGLKSNFVDVPTDCPQRDERVGWLGDAQIFCRTACYLMNAYTFYAKWLWDVKEDQLEDGGVPHIVPDIFTMHTDLGWHLSQGSHSAAAWADAAVINPWTLYLVYGDKEILRRQYTSMKKWIQFMEQHAQDYIWNYRLQFGDWVALDAKEGSYFGATPNDLTCTAYFAYSTELFAKIAEILGKKEDAAYYCGLYERIKEKYQRTFFGSDGHLKAQTQTAQIVTLYFHLAPEEYIQNVIEDLLKLLKNEKGHLVTGFVGTPYFCHVLNQNGHLKEAYALLLKEDFPSWLYQVKAGATTVWEHWDGMKPDGSMWSPDMNSFNHYAYGAIGEWLYRVVAGIEIDETEPGYKKILIQPHIGGGLSYAEGRYESMYGEIVSFWEVQGKEAILSIKIPVNTTAQIYLEQAEQICDSDGIDFIKEEKGIVGSVGSGEYKVKFMMEK